MASLFRSGFELQSVTDGVEWDTNTGSPTISTSIKRSGAASLRVNPSASQVYARRTIASPIASKTFFIRFYLYIASAPDTLIQILRVNTILPNDVVTIRLNTDRTLELWNGGTPGQLGSDSSPLNTNQWYRIEVKFVTNATPQVTDYEAKIDGVVFASASGRTDGIANLATLAAFGCATTATADLYFDDIAINDNTGTQQTSYPGVGSIVHMHPDTAGDNNNASAGDYTSVDEVTPDDATTIAVLDDDNDILDVNCETSANAAIGAADNITLVQVGIREAAVSAALESWKLRIKSQASGTVLEGTTTTHDDTTYKTNGEASPRNYTLTSYTDPQAGGVWTPALLDTMQIGIQAVDATPDINVSTLWALVEYIPPIPNKIIQVKQAINRSNTY